MEARPARLWEDPETKQAYEVQKWRDALADWTCPTPADNSFSPDATGAADPGACDPCGKMVWGNWCAALLLLRPCSRPPPLPPLRALTRAAPRPPATLPARRKHVACRGPPLTPTTYRTGGDGYVTTVHVTDCENANKPTNQPTNQPTTTQPPNQPTTAHDLKIAVSPLGGPVPLAELCPLSRLREFDIDGGGLEGPLPGGFGACFPELREIDLSYNELTGEIPAEITGAKSLQEFKVDYNRLTGKLPAGLGGMPKIQWWVEVWGGGLSVWPRFGQHPRAQFQLKLATAAF
jgi:hypothetical protein